jgi:hypothetical protein
MINEETEGWLIFKTFPALVKLPSLATVANVFNCHRVINRLLIGRSGVSRCPSEKSKIFLRMPFIRLAYKAKYLRFLYSKTGMFRDIERKKLSGQEQCPLKPWKKRFE